MITIKEIAKSLGVSTATVSNVIHGHLNKMSPETAEMIRRKLAEYDYIPNMGARMLARGDSRIISLITNYPNFVDRLALMDPFISEVVATLESEIRARDYYMMLYAAQTAAEINSIAQTWNTLGMIVMGLQPDQARELLRVSRRPIVFIDCFFGEAQDYHNVGLQDRLGGYQLTRYLLDMGHRDILFLSDQESEPLGVDAERMRGHKEALAEAGIAWHPSRYRQISRDRDIREGEVRALARDIGHPHTAMMFCSDYYAVDVMRMLQKLGMQVPRDVSITGFDDNYLAHMANPRLTTMHQDTAEKGVRALALLLELVDDPAAPTRNIVLPVRLVEGETVRNLNE